eukprot:3244261-Rhodomonas_salina.1
MQSSTKQSQLVTKTNTCTPVPIPCTEKYGLVKFVPRAAVQLRAQDNTKFARFDWIELEWYKNMNKTNRNKTEVNLKERQVEALRQYHCTKLAAALSRALCCTAHE